MSEQWCGYCDRAHAAPQAKFRASDGAFVEIESQWAQPMPAGLTYCAYCEAHHGAPVIDAPLAHDDDDNSVYPQDRAALVRLMEHAYVMLGDQEDAHIEADGLITTYLRVIAHEMPALSTEIDQLIALYERIGKWYA